jgi:hypothetical protein
VWEGFSDDSSKDVDKHAQSENVNIESDLVKLRVILSMINDGNGRTLKNATDPDPLEEAGGITVDPTGTQTRP